MTYPVMEYYYTLQGEGFHSGRAAFFIRLGGCDVGCVWCDSKESWDSKGHPILTVDEICYLIKQSNTEIAVITGGEPTMHDLNLLCQRLKENRIKTHLETSGAYPVSGKFDWVTVSPKKFKPPIEESLKIANELKVVLYNKTDFEWAEANAKKTSPDCMLYLQPEWSVSEKINPLIIQYVMDNPQWRLSLQTHKYINIS